MPQYLYGIIASPKRELPPGLIGIEGHSVHLLESGALAALASDYPNEGPVMTLRRNLAPHNLVLTEAMRHQSILPMRFGHVVDSAAEVKRFLHEHRERLQRLLTQVEGCCELGLRVSLCSVNLFERMVGLYRELALLRDELFGGGRKPDREEAMRLGRLFETCLRQERERHEKRIVGPLRGALKEFTVRPPRREEVLLDVALLVLVQRREQLEARIDEVGSHFGPEYLFELTGPFAPFSFSTVDAEA